MKNMRTNIKFKKTKYWLKTKKQAFGRTLFSVAVLAAAFALPIICVKTNVFGLQTEEALVGVASILITALSAVFVVFQLRDSENVTCCSMLSEMNLSFIENERLMLLYQKLEECYREPKKELQVIDDDNSKNVHTADLVAYFTFFEVLNEYVKHKVVTIAQLDDLFGYRFFILVHNRYIQERELYAVPSSYVNIFQLYSLWMEYRKINITDKQSRLVIMQENQIPEYYLKNKTYLQERAYQNFLSETIELTRKKKTKKFHAKSLFPSDLPQMLEVQDEVLRSLEQPNLFERSTEEEILESMLVDGCYGIFDEEKLVAFSVLVLNRKSERNLCVDWVGQSKNEPFWEYLTFDSVQVLPSYRGFGMQRYFLHLAENIAAITRAKYIVATVSPENSSSIENFKKSNYAVHPQKNPYVKYKKKRLLIRKEL